MFYAQFVLSKKGPLSKIWLAAHWERKLSKAQIFETNVQDAVDEILKPKVKLSLRTTGHLLLGIVRIYSRKAKYVLADCNEAFLKIKMAFRPGAIENDMREKGDDREGGDVPEIDFFDVLPDINDFETNINHLQINQSRIDDITLREENFETSSQRNLAFDGELGFDDFGEREQREQSNLEFDLAQGHHDLDGSDVEKGRREASEGSLHRNNSQNITLLEDDFRANKGNDGFGNDFEDFGPATDLDMLFDENELLNPASVQPPTAGLEEMEVDQMAPTAQNIASTQESFTLEPLDTAALQQQAQEKAGRQKRKRRLVIDEHKNIKGDEMKANMTNYCDTIQPLDLAPPTKLLMRLKENGTVEKLFSMPGCIYAIQDSEILRLYQSRLVVGARISTHDNLSEDIRRDLEMVDNLDDDYSHFEDFAAPHSPLHQNGAEPEIDENMEPLSFNDTLGAGGVVADASIVDEKRSSSARRSRVQEREEEDADDEEVFTRRTKSILNAIAQKLRVNEHIVFEDLLARTATRRTAAQKFYALLELHKRHAIVVQQSEPFGEIVVMQGNSMDDTLALVPQ